MSRTLSNRPVAVIVAVFTVITAALLHRNPFGDGEISWFVSILVALAANCFLAYVVAAWAAPYLASTGGRAGADQADPHAVAVAERWTTATLGVFGILALLAVAFSTSEVVITPTERLEKNAELVRRTVESQAPKEYQRQLTAADTWKMSDRTYRTCVPTPNDNKTGWCVLVRADGDDLTVVKYGFGKSNAAQALEWHPELKDQSERRF